MWYKTDQISSASERRSKKQGYWLATPPPPPPPPPPPSEEAPSLSRYQSVMEIFCALLHIGYD
jgi:hypothetical protein